MTSFRWMKLVAICGALMAASTGCDDGGEDNNGGFAATGAGAGGMMTTGGVGGMMTTGGAGGMMATGGMGGAGGMMSGGTGGMMATGGMGGGGEVDMACVTDVLDSGRDMTCAECACVTGASGCATEIEKIRGVQVAADMLACTKAANCGGECCLCVDACDPGGANYGTGPCSDEIETAAGVTPGGGALFNGTAVQMACDVAMSPADSACGNVSRLGACIEMKCKAECMSPTCAAAP